MADTWLHNRSSAAASRFSSAAPHSSSRVRPYRCGKRGGERTFSSPGARAPSPRWRRSTAWRRACRS
eukprot:5911346-Prymnesium_polylepis.1